MTHSTPKPKPFPTLSSDSDAETFVAEADLTAYDWSGMKRVQFEFQAKDTSVNLRLPKALLEAVREQAKAQGVPYQRFIRLALEQAIA
jgi:predicted DNA binding CopG/RHH family protein